MRKMFEDARYDELRRILHLLENGAGAPDTTKFLWEWAMEGRRIYGMHKDTPSEWFIDIMEGEPDRFPRMR